MSQQRETSTKPDTDNVATEYFLFQLGFGQLNYSYATIADIKHEKSNEQHRKSKL